MSRLAILAKRVITPETVIPHGVVLVDGKRILRVGSRSDVSFNERDFPTLHFENQTLVPGFVDVHIHGSGGHDVMEGTRDAIAVISNFLADTEPLLTSPLPSLHRRSHHRAVENVGKLIQQEIDGARILGIHLGGPFHQREKARSAPTRIYSKSLRSHFR